MKNLFLLFLIVFLFSACKKDRAQTLFIFPLQNIDTELPPTLSVFQVHYFNIKDVPTNYAGLLGNNNTVEEQIERIIPREANLSVIFGNTDYDFIEQMSVRICNQGDESENCGTEIFYRQPVPRNVGSVLGLVPSDIDIKEYLMQDAVNIQIKLERLRTPPPMFVETRLEIDFAVR